MDGTAIVQETGWQRSPNDGGVQSDDECNVSETADKWDRPVSGKETRHDAGPSAKKWAAQWRKGKTGHGKGRRSRPA